MNIYFIRHGESESNEQNLFAGRFDTPLTNLGMEQAKQALARVKTLKLHFDEIHHSPLSRATDTAKVLQQGFPEVKLRESESLLERDFGKLSEQNKSLIKKFYGASEFESMFHSFEGKAPEGESFFDLYTRTERYLSEVLMPIANEGKSILVVAHKYTIEAFALIAAKIDPRDYQDFRVPNAKVLSLIELASCAKSSSKKMNHLAEETEARLTSLLLAATFLGILVKLILRLEIPHNIELALMVTLLGINTFFGYLRLNPRYFFKATQSLETSARSIALRLSLGIGLILWNPHPLLATLGILFLLPPAGLASTLSLMWGGNFFLASQTSILLSLASPLLLLFLQVSGYLHLSISHLLLITIVGTVAPALFAQRYRAIRPMEAGALTTNWSFLGSIAMIALSFVVAYANSSSSLLNFRPEPIVACLLLLIVNRALALLAAKITKATEAERLDIFIQNLLPNIFLLALFPSLRESGCLPILNLINFTLIFMEERGIVSKFPILAGLSAKPGKARPSFLRIRNKERISA